MPDPDLDPAILPPHPPPPHGQYEAESEAKREGESGNEHESSRLLVSLNISESPHQHHHHHHHHHHHDASTESTPGISSLDGTPRYLDFLPNLPSPAAAVQPPPPPPLPPPSPPDMPVHVPGLLEPNLHTTNGPLNLHHLSPDRDLSSTMRRPLHAHDPSATTGARDVVQGEVAPLSEITHLLRLQKYHKRRCVQSRDSLHYLQISAARTARVSRAARAVHHTLAECIRSEDKTSFANLLHAFQDSCDDAVAPTSPLLPDSDSTAAPDANTTASFLDTLSNPSRAVILDFLTKLRHDGSFLADRLVSLTQRELNALLPEKSVPKSTDSVFATPSRSASRTSRPLGYVVDSQVDLLSSFSHGSPLEALIFAPAALLSLHQPECDRATDVWATACARLISQQKSGSERLIPAVLDTWTTLLPWPGKARLEVWILQTLQRGAFLLDQPAKQTFRARVEGRSDNPAQDEARMDAFLADAADSLLELLGDQTIPSVVPPGALYLCQSIFRKLQDSPGHQRALPSFVLTRWLFSSYVQDLVTLPEAHDMLTDHYISQPARLRILQQVVVRAQRAAYDVAYSWKHGSVIAAGTVTRVNAIMARFQSFKPIRDTAGARSIFTSDSESFLAVSIKDVTTMLSALYPQRRPASISSDPEYLKAGLKSSASSLSGFSLFRNASSSTVFSDSVGVPSDHTSFLGIESDSSTLGSDDVHHAREALLELEELASRRISTSKEFWEILSAASDAEPLMTFRDRCSQIRTSNKCEGSRAGVASAPNTPSAELKSCIASVEALLSKYGADAGQAASNRTGGMQDLATQWNQLEQLFEIAIEDCEARGDFVDSHHWFTCLQDVRETVFQSANFGVFRHMLQNLELGVRKSLHRTTLLQTAYENWSSPLKSRPVLRTTYLDPLLERNEQLRDKMWYVSDVRTSASYEEARSIASALRVMGKTKRVPKVRTAPPLRHWSTSKVSSGSLHLKTEAQILDLLSAKLEHGGPNKLGDEQARLTSQWMQRENIDNLCKGEERLHKLCMEIRKCVDHITDNSSSDNSLLWSNVLFARDEKFRQHVSVNRRPSIVPSLYGIPPPSGFLSLGGQIGKGDYSSSASHTLSNSSSRDFLDARSPTLTNGSSMPFWSPAASEIDLPSSATSLASSRTQSALDPMGTKAVESNRTPNHQALDQLRLRITGLVLSDLTSILFSDGSETDRAFWTGLGSELTERYFRSLHVRHSSIGSQTPTREMESASKPPTRRFHFEHAFGNLLQIFSATSNPSKKLTCLHDINKLLVPFMAEQDSVRATPTSLFRATSGMAQLTIHTSMDDPTETSIAGFRVVFAKSKLRPKTIFRDLQYIAALLPSSMLQTTPQGKAFCNAAVAITSLKTEARKIMVETADSIIAYHSNNRGHGRSSSLAQQQRDSATFAVPSPPAEDIGRYSMADAAHLLQIAAKEGDPVAQRELATLYLTHPELMDHIIAPFARPRDVFKEELEGKWKKTQDPARCDPTTMCVAHHWMSLSSMGGDSLAKEVLRQREEMDSF